MLNDNRAEANQLRLAFKKIAKEKQLIYCLKFNAKGVPCADGKCRYYPCCEWSQLYEIEVAAGGLKGSFYEGMPDSMKPKAKEKRPLNNINHKRLDQLRARRTHAPPPSRTAYAWATAVRCVRRSLVASWLLEPT